MRYASLLALACVVAACEKPPAQDERVLADPPSGPPPEAEPVAEPLPKAESHAESSGKPIVSFPQVTIGPSLPKELIQRIINSHKDEIRRCYELGLKRNENLAGKVTMKWVIQATGKVGSAKVESSTLDDAGVERCMVKAIKKWQFMRPAGGGVVEVRYPFELRQ